jgi:hypothetical protein
MAAADAGVFSRERLARSHSVPVDSEPLWSYQTEGGMFASIIPSKQARRMGSHLWRCSLADDPEKTELLEHFENFASQPDESGQSGAANTEKTEKY